jgi:hypothetical protein
MKKLTLFFALVAGVAHAQIVANIPSTRYTNLPKFKVGVDKARSLGLTYIRTGVGLNSGSLNVNPSTIDLTDALTYAKAKGIKAVQLGVGYAPADTGSIKNLPDEKYWPATAQEVQKFVDAADFLCGSQIDLAFQIGNEWDTRIGAAFNTVTGRYLWQEQGLPQGSVVYQQIRYGAYIATHVNWHGRKLSIHTGAGIVGKSFDNDAGHAVINAILASHGWVAINCYPNTTFNKSTAIFNSHYLTYTLPNAIANLKASPFSVLEIRLGETQIKRGGVSDSQLPVFRTAYYAAIAKLRGFVLYQVVGEDGAFAVWDTSGKLVCGSVKVPVIATGVN